MFLTPVKKWSQAADVFNYVFNPRGLFSPTLLSGAQTWPIVSRIAVR
jgi:hypothetical protein